MKQAVVVCSILLFAFAGCSKGDKKSGEGSGADAHDSPKAVVEALFAEGQKEKPDKEAVLKFLSKEMQDEINSAGMIDDFIKHISEAKLSNVEDVTMHETGSYARVHVVLTIDGKDDKERIPTIKVDGQWFLHTRYGPKQEKSGSSKSDSRGGVSKRE